MNEAPVCDVCGKPATLHITSVTGMAGRGEGEITGSENYCAECAVARDFAEEGFNRPKAYIPQMAKQFANILGYPRSNAFEALRASREIPMPPHMEEFMRRIRQSDGYNADFSPQSLWEIDRFYDDHCEKGVVKTDAPFSRNFERHLPSVGFYIGEVVVRRLGGEWEAENDDEPGAEMNFAVRLSNGTLCWPVQRAWRRFELGPSEGIAAWGWALGLPVGERPKPPAS